MRGQPLTMSIAEQPGSFYDLMEQDILLEMDNIFPKWFSDEILRFYKDVMDSIGKE